VPYDNVHAVDLTALVLGIAACVSAAAAMAWRRMSRRQAEELAELRRLHSRMHPKLGFDNNAQWLLDGLSQYVEAPVYALYVLDRSARKYTLRAIRHAKADVGQAAPSYSGLVPYAGEPYLPPAALPADRAVDRPFSWIREEGALLLQIPAAENRVLVLAGPIAKRGGRAAERAARAADAIAPMAGWALEVDRLEEEAKEAGIAGEAWRRLSQLVSDPEEAVRHGFRLAAAALDLEPIELDEGGPEADEGASVAAETAENPRRHVFRCRYRTPSGTRRLAFRAVRLPFGWDAERAAQFLEACCRGAERYYAEREGAFRAGRKADALKRIADLLDGMTPWTVGHAEQMSRYAAVLAKELGWPDEEVQRTALAAHLSNIGAAALPVELLTKEGRFAESEYEQMKRHADLGALLVESVLGSRDTAAAIRHHHERIDGGGYPDRLTGDDIPRGARVIAVVQTFLAAVHGRKGRDPLPFDKAIEKLEALSGLHLDAEAVAAFIRWLARKREGARSDREPIAACWDLLCTPSELCEGCPAFGRRDRPCWETEANRCRLHGKSCETCLIYTEASTRSDMRGKTEAAAAEAGALEEAGRSARPKPAPDRIDRFMIYYGAVDDAILERLKAYDFAIVEPNHWTQAAVRTLQSAGTRIAGYVSVMEWPTWNAARGEKLQDGDFLRRGGERVHFPEWDSYLMDIRRERYRRIVLDEIDRTVVALGCDAVFLDTVGDIDDHIDSALLRNELIQGYLELLAGIKERHPSLMIVQNRGFHALAAAAKYLDGFLWEDWRDALVSDRWVEAQINTLQMLKKRGLRLFAVSLDGGSGTEGRAARRCGFVHLSRTSDYVAWCDDETPDRREAGE